MTSSGEKRPSPTAGALRSPASSDRVGLSMRVISRLRIWGARLAYNRIIAFIVTNKEWRERLFGSFDLGGDKQVLIVGPRSFSSALLFAQRNPSITFYAIEGLRGSKKSTRQAQQRGLTNVRFLDVTTDGPLPFDNDTFDAIVCAFAFHRLAPTQKVTMMRDLTRVLRAAGRLHLVELTQPQANQEGMMLGFARLVWGADAVLPHYDGSWVRLLSQGGLEGIRRDQSFSITVGRLALASAKKPTGYPKAAAPVARRRKGR